MQWSLEKTKMSSLRRQLSIDNAVSTVTYRVGDVTYTEEAFTSFTDQMLIIRVKMCIRDRLIIILDQYFRLTPATMVRNTPEIAELSTNGMQTSQA